MIRGDFARLALVVCVAAIGFTLAAPRFAERLNPLTGDEPFYVMTAISLVRDHDLDEANNYADRDYDEFYPSQPLPSDWQGWPSFPTTLPPHPAKSVLPGLHTKHGIGLSVLIALPYEVAGRAGAMVFMIAIGALVVGQMFLLALETGASMRVSAFLALGLGFTLPIAPYALLIFPELPGALAIIYAIRRLTQARNSSWQWLQTGLAIGALPWLHQRFVPTAALLGVFLLWRLWRQRGVDIAVACGIVGLSAAGLVVYNSWLYDSPLQNRADHAGFSGIAGTVNGGFGLLLDAQWGLIVNAPIYLLAIAAFPLWFRAGRQRAWLALAAVLPYLLMVAAYRVWWGEWGPAARYLVPVAPLAAATLAAMWVRVGNSTRVLTGAAWLAGALLTLIGVANPQRFYHQPDGLNHLVDRLGEILHIDLASRLVAFQPYAIGTRADRLLAGLVLALACWIAVAFVYAPARESLSGSFGGSPTPQGDGESQ